MDVLYPVLVSRGSVSVSLYNHGDEMGSNPEAG